MTVVALRLDGIVRTFRQAGRSLEVLRGASLDVARGEMVALVGPSGAGKSTLLQIAGLLEKPDGGEIVVDGEACTTMPDSRRTELRGRKLGFVYQFHHLLPEFSALENIVLPQMIVGTSRRDASLRGQELLRTVGLEARQDHRPARLSGGEQQRVAIVRAIANAPAVLLVDEPTGNLDPHTAADVFAELTRLVRETEVAALVATHNLALAHRMDRVVQLEEGRLVPVEG